MKIRGRIKYHLTETAKNLGYALIVMQVFYGFLMFFLLGIGTSAKSLFWPTFLLFVIIAGVVQAQFLKKDTHPSKVFILASPVLFPILFALYGTFIESYRQGNFAEIYQRDTGRISSVYSLGGPIYYICLTPAVIAIAMHLFRIARLKYEQHN